MSGEHVVNHHTIPAQAVERLRAHIGEVRAHELDRQLRALKRRLSGRRLVNITGDDRRKGGVYEILRGALPYLRGAGVNVEWIDLPTRAGDRPALEFFHALAHGRTPTGARLDMLTQHAEELRVFAAAAAGPIRAELRSDDVVLLHDTQAAPLVPELRGRVSRVGWHGHIGTLDGNDGVRAYWKVFEPWVAEADFRFVYQEGYLPVSLRSGAVSVTPGLDPASAKNAPLAADEGAGLLAEPPSGWPLVWRTAGRPRAGSLGTALAISRWDVLKDMPGAVRVFGLVAERFGSSFCGIVVGPSAESAAEREQLDLALSAHSQLSEASRQSVHVGVIEDCGTAAHDDVVRALQSAADVFVQKSRQEGFGLTVAESLLRGKPVIASRVGGIPLQVNDGVDGMLLLPDTADEVWAAALSRLVSDRQLRAHMGQAARQGAVEHHVVDRQIAASIAGVLEPSRGPRLSRGGQLADSGDEVPFDRGEPTALEPDSFVRENDEPTDHP